jgi:hypothetical protein
VPAILGSGGIEMGNLAGNPTYVWPIGLDFNFQSTPGSTFAEITVAAAPATYSCVGFEPPADRDVVVKKPNRVVPLRMTLLDGDGTIVWDIAAPVVNVAYSGSHIYAEDELEELNFVGRGDEGNMFAFDGSKWAFNLSTKGLAPGEYTITAVAGSPDYSIDPTCQVVVTIQ